MWEDLTAMRLLVCGGRHFDDAALVEIVMSGIHAKTPISVMIHGGLPGIGFPAEAWARRNNVHVIRYPANFSLGKAGDSTRDLFMLEDSRPETLLVFPGGRRTSELLREAGWKNIRVMDVSGTERDCQAAPIPAKGLRARPLPVDRERRLLAV
jgi:hypothetical protein